MGQKIKLPKKSLQALFELADLRGHTLDETLRHAINTEVYMDKQVRKGSMILVKDSLDQVWKVVFTHNSQRVDE